jgi:hypothetical protein
MEVERALCSIARAIAAKASASSWMASESAAIHRYSVLGGIIVSFAIKSKSRVCQIEVDDRGEGADRPVPRPSYFRFPRR